MMLLLVAALVSGFHVNASGSGLRFGFDQYRELDTLQVLPAKG